MTDETNPKDRVGEKKAPLHLIPGPFLVVLALVMRLGAKKYGPYNWREKKVRLTVYLSAAMRHLTSCLDGEWTDPESGQPHLGHAAACCAIVIDAYLTGNLIDDRPPAGVTSKLIAETTQTDEAAPVPAAYSQLGTTLGSVWRGVPRAGSV